MRVEQLKGVVFDMDGLIFNTELLYPRVATELLRRRELLLTQELTDAMMGRPAPDAFAVMINWHGLTDTIDMLSAESEEIFSAILEDSLELMPGLLELLKGLEQAGYPKGVATSARTATAEDLLGRFDLVERFEFIIGGDKVSRGKPDPEVYLAAADRLGLAPGEIAVFEDSHTGCKAAIAAGTYAIAVPGDHSRAHDFNGAKFVANTLADPRIHATLGL